MKTEESDTFLPDVERNLKMEQEYTFEEAFELTGKIFIMFIHPQQRWFF